MALFDGFLLVSDVDATLLDEKKNIPAANLAAIERFKALGGAFTIIVRHGDYYSVYSNLASVGVHRGQQVSTRQTLGAVAGDGNGNTMLHFQLRHNTQKLNPLSWFAH